MKPVFASIAAVVLAASAPALAGHSGSAPAAGTIAADRNNYCVQSFQTGSRIPRYDCASRAAWIARGFDPVAK